MGSETEFRSHLGSPITFGFRYFRLTVQPEPRIQHKEALSKENWLFLFTWHAAEFTSKDI